MGFGVLDAVKGWLLTIFIVLFMLAVILVLGLVSSRYIYRDTNNPYYNMPNIVYSE